MEKSETIVLIILGISMIYATTEMLKMMNRELELLELEIKYREAQISEQQDSD